MNYDKLYKENKLKPGTYYTIIEDNDEYIQQYNYWYRKSGEKYLSFDIEPKKVLDKAPTYKELQELKGLVKIKEDKIKEEDINDFETLLKFWEQKKSGKKYKDDKSRERILKKLKELTNDDLEYAKKAILFSIDMGYVGFYNGNGLFYRPQRNKNYTGDYPL